MTQALPVFFILSFMALGAAGAANPDPRTEDLSQFIREPTGLYRRFDFESSDPGGGPSPGEGDIITLNLRGTDKNGRVFVDTFKSGKPVEVTLGRQSRGYFERVEGKSPVAGVGKGWDQILRMMRKGDHVTLIMPPELAVLPGQPLVPQDGRLRFEAKIVDIAFAQEKALSQAKAEMAQEKIAVPADSKELNRLGYQALYDSNDPQKAGKYFRWNAALFPQEPRLYESLGEAYLQQGDVPRAVETYEKALDAGKSENAQLVVARLKADPRSLSWLQEQARGAYEKGKAAAPGKQ